MRALGFWLTLGASGVIWAGITYWLILSLITAPR